MALENSKQNIVLDLTYPVLQNIRCVQYDTESRIIGITITDNSKLYKILDTYGIIFKQSKPDGTFVERKDACTILSDGTIELLLPEQSTTCPGLSKCQLEIIDNSVIHTLHFNLVVEKSVIGNQDIESQVDSDILTDMNKHLTDYDNPHKMPIASDKELGIIKSGTDITVDDSGNVSVNDNSHKHTVSNISDLTATAAELNVLDGITATTTELNYTDGVTSNIQTQLNSKAPLASPTLSGTPTAPTASAGTNTTQIATTAFVQTAVSNGIAASDALIFKGTLGTSGTVTALPTTYKTGWTYRVITAGTYAGQVCEIGDLIVALVDRSGSGNLDADWCVAQTNIDGTITGIKSGDAYIEVSQTDSVATIKHKDISRTNTTSTAKPSHGGTFTAVDSVTSDSKGHVTGINTKTVTLPNTAVAVDSSLSSTSTNPVQNKAVYSALSGKANSSHSHAISDVSGLQSSLSDCFTASQPRTANTVLAAPNGYDGSASFRALVAADLPSHSHDYIPTSASCNRNWNWSGQGGQPTWLWGGEDGTNMYVYCPANFSVNYANSSGSATLDGNGNNIASTYALKSIYGDAAISLGRKSGTTVGVNSIVTGGTSESTKQYPNTASGRNSAAIAGSDNESLNSNDVVIGGSWNTANSEGGFGCAIVSSLSCNATGNCSVILGGSDSTASRTGAVVMGQNNSGDGSCTVVIGNHNTGLQYQLVMGSYNNTSTATENDYSGAGTGTAFVIGNGTSSSSRSNALRIRSDGQIYSAKTNIATGADYAEYFEWSDKNVNNEDRVGHFVTFDKNDPEKIRFANEGDYILGIVSALPSVIGNGDEDWRKRYILDDFGRYIEETFECEEEKIIGYSEDNKPIIEKKTHTVTKWKENPEYDSTQIYIERDQRPEWDAIGMIGVLSVIDDGTCVVNGYCRCSDNGIATATDDKNGYRVIKRVTDNIVKVVFR